MINRPSPSCLTLLLLLAIPALRAPAQSTTPSPTQSARNAVAAFMQAVDTADPQALQNLIHTDPRESSQQVGLQAVIDCITAQRQLETAFNARFGEQAVAPLIAQTRFTPLDRQAVQTATVEFRNNHEALVSTGPGVSPIVLHATADAQWRVVLRPIATLHDIGAFRSPEPDSQRRIAYMRSVARIVRRVADQVDKKQITTLTSAQKSLQTALEVLSNSEPALD